jgi:uncharacterized protein (DUF433 family)
MPFEILHRALMFFSGGEGGKRTQIPPFAGLGIFLARIEPILAVFQFADHDSLGGNQPLYYHWLYHHHFVVQSGNYTMQYARITFDPLVCTGKPCIRGLRFPVSRLLGLLAANETRESILNSFPYLEDADIDEALRYAADLAEDQTIELAK